MVRVVVNGPSNNVQGVVPPYDPSVDHFQEIWALKIHYTAQVQFLAK